MTRPAVRLSDELRRRIVDHCRAELPNEGCGLLAMAGDEVVDVYPTGNREGSPSAYTVPPEEHFAALTRAESRGLRLGGVFHSHPRGGARLSTTDVRGGLEPSWIYVVVGLRGAPTVRAWSIRATRVEEIELT